MRFYVMFTVLLACSQPAIDTADSGVDLRWSARSGPEPGVWTFSFTRANNTLFSPDPAPESDEAELVPTNYGDHVNGNDEVAFMGLWPNNEETSGSSLLIQADGSFSVTSQGSTGGAVDYPDFPCLTNLVWSFETTISGRFLDRRTLAMASEAHQTYTPTGSCTDDEVLQFINEYQPSALGTAVVALEGDYEVTCSGVWGTE